MTPDQEAHLARVKKAFVELVDVKYRKGQAEHGGDLHRVETLRLIDFAIDEAIDQVVYLLTIREQFTGGPDGFARR